MEKRALVTLIAVLTIGCSSPQAARPGDGIPDNAPPDGPRTSAASTWTVATAKNPLTDRTVVTATAQARGTVEPFVYELQLAAIDGVFQRDAQLSAYEAAPTGLEFVVSLVTGVPNGLGKTLRIRFDNDPVVRVTWVQTDFANRGKMNVSAACKIEDAYSLVEVVRAARCNELMQTIKNRIVVQGLRGSNETVEFLIDPSFNQFRSALQTTIITEANTLISAREAAKRAQAERQAREDAERAEAGRIAAEEREKAEQAELERERAEDTLVPTPVKDPKIIKRMEPVYPAIAQSMRLRGRVEVEVIVGSNGKVRKARILRSSSSFFDQVSLDAAKEWVFEPTVINGKPVPMVTTIEFGFSLD